jgi:hypothetical protein
MNKVINFILFILKSKLKSPVEQEIKNIIKNQVYTDELHSKVSDYLSSYLFGKFTIIEKSQIILAKTKYKGKLFEDNVEICKRYVNTRDNLMFKDKELMANFFGNDSKNSDIIYNKIILLKQTDLDFVWDSIIYLVNKP